MGLVCGNESHMPIDGGFTDWALKILNSKKERLLTRGLGIEYSIRLLSR